MEEITIDILPNETLQKIFEYIIGNSLRDEDSIPKLYKICRKWYENYIMVHPKWKLLQKNLTTFANMSFYDVKIFKKIIENRSCEKIKSLRALFTRYKNCNIIETKNEILVRFSDPSKIISRSIYLSCVLILKFDYFNLELLANVSENARLIEITEIPYKSEKMDVIIEEIKIQIVKYLETKKVKCSIDYYEDKIDFLLFPTLEDICNNKLIAN